MNILRALWPTDKKERGLFFLMLVITALININFSLLRGAKAALVVTGSGGAEVIPHLLFWGVLPAAFVITGILSRLKRWFQPQTVFYVTTTAFVLFFVTFAFFFYPYREVLHPDWGWLSQLTHSRWRGLATVVQQWTFSAYFIFAEMWKVALLTVLFWGFINRHVLLAEAKRLYAPVMFGGCIGGILAGPLTSIATSQQLYSLLGSTCEKWHFTLIVVSVQVAFFAVLLVFAFRRLSIRLAGHELQKIEQKEKLDLTSSVRHLVRSPYLLYLTLLVFADYVAYSFSEVMFLDKLHQLVPNANDYCRYMGHLSLWGGVITGISALFITPILVQRFPWVVGAMICPFILLATCIPFFGCICFETTGSVSWVAHLLRTTPLGLAVMFGAIQYVVCRGMKYTLFDTTKELAFVPLDGESQVKGKLIIDGIAARCGRASASGLNILLVGAFSSLDAAAPFAALLSLLFIYFWGVSVKGLGDRFTEEPIGAVST